MTAVETLPGGFGYTPRTISAATERVYAEVTTRLDETCKRGWPAVMQQELGVRVLGLAEVESTGAMEHLQWDLTAHEYSSSYKIYGASNATLAARETNSSLQKLHAASAGNHGEAVAAVGKLLGLSVTIATAKDASPAKLKRIEALGAEVDASFDSLPEALIASEAAGLRKNSTFIHPYNDYDVLAGQSLIGMKLIESLLEQGVTGRVVVPVPVGGGGLASGLAIGSRFAHEFAEAAGVTMPFHLKFYGVQMENGDLARRAVHNFKNSRPHATIDDLFPDNDANRKNDGTFAIPGSLTLPMLASKRYTKSITTVSEAQVGEAMRTMTQQLYNRDNPKFVEPAGALSAAWVEARRSRLADSSEPVTVVSLLTGTNVTMEHYDYFVDVAAEARNQQLLRIGGALLSAESQAPVRGRHARSPRTQVWSAPTTRSYIRMN